MDRKARVGTSRAPKVRHSIATAVRPWIFNRRIIRAPKVRKKTRYNPMPALRASPPLI